jgi:hypothetical protein
MFIQNGACLRQFNNTTGLFGRSGIDLRILNIECKGEKTAAHRILPFFYFTTAEYSDFRVY